MTTYPPHKSEHADKIVVIPGANSRLTLKRVLVGYAYANHGNLHNPTPRYLCLLLADGKIVDSDDRKDKLVKAARDNGAGYLS